VIGGAVAGDAIVARGVGVDDSDRAVGARLDLIPRMLRRSARMPTRDAFDLESANVAAAEDVTNRERAR